MRFLSRKEHMSYGPAFFSLFRSVKLKICRSNVVLYGEAQPTGQAVDRLRLAFELKERTHGRLIQLDVNVLDAEGRSVFFVTKFGPEAQTTEGKRPTAVD